MKQIFAHIKTVDEETGKVREADLSKDTDNLTFWFDRSHEYFTIRSIDYDTGDLELEYPRITLKSGQSVHFEHYNYHLDVTIDYRMEDDGVPCNEDTLQIKLEYLNYEPNNSSSSEYILPYRLGAETPENFPYKAVISELKNEEVVLSVKDKLYTVQLHKGNCRNDQYGVATGVPNDPVDYIGPRLFMTLERKE